MVAFGCVWRFPRSDHSRPCPTQQCSLQTPLLVSLALLKVLANLFHASQQQTKTVNKLSEKKFCEIVTRKPLKKGGKPVIEFTHDIHLQHLDFLMRLRESGYREYDDYMVDSDGLMNFNSVIGSAF